MRYPKDTRLSSIVDQLQAIKEELAERGDYENAIRLDHARLDVLAVAIGVRR